MQVLKLQAAIKFDTQDLAGCKMLIDQLNQDDAETLVNQACFAFKVFIFIVSHCVKFFLSLIA
jgi:tetratricopeptide repeat protein 30